jgi:D-sedoheptulose 7-phosphate isomerase
MSQRGWENDLDHARFTAKYLERAREALAALDHGEVERCCEVLLDCARRDGTLFIVGNGGSAALADHLACDLVKGVLGRGYPVRSSVRPRALSLSANAALLSAWANDVGYAVAFAEGLRSLARPGDALLVISASGKSENVLAALAAAGELGIETLGWLGFDGGPARALCETSVLVPVVDYGIVESAHATLGHLVTEWMRQRLEEEPALESRFQPRFAAVC